jgi:hypothetical protein
MGQDRFLRGWDEERVRRVLDHYDAQSDEEAVAEDEAAYESTTHTAMEIPVDLVQQVRELIAKRKSQLSRAEACYPEPNVGIFSLPSSHHLVMVLPAF